MNKKNVLITWSTWWVWYHLTKLISSNWYFVLAWYRNEKIKDELLSWDENIFPIKIDVTDENSIKEAKEIIVEKFWKLDFLINNSWIWLWWPLEYINIEDFKKVYDVNVFWNIRMCQTFIDLLKRSGWKIINIWSMWWKISFPFLIPYGSSKNVMRFIYDWFRRELDWKVKFVNIELWAVYTPIWDNAMKNTNSSIVSKSAINEYSEFFDIWDIDKKIKKFCVNINKINKVILKILSNKNLKNNYFIYKNEFFIEFAKFLPDFLVDFIIKIILKRLK